MVITLLQQPNIILGIVGQMKEFLTLKIYILYRNLPKETGNTNLKEHKHPYVHCSVIYNHQDMEKAQVSISR